MDKLLKLFNEIYDDFYNNGYNHKLSSDFDTAMENNYFKSIVFMFNDLRNDFISSDREAAAFMAAYTTLYD